ncbi:O-antigen ligase-like membrane protein [Mariniflexile fucanivorans]|uniref:O-antigen ligase-like membrane protein n=1 Tax=Mariniflexile fucanivorans TaxID=264023 RepID=A0A4R1RE43_9FLAO|nr:O-antigen ligase family protein [Mariniflexile fucanivorans]TCL63900.1 O-antigen ligase-like membrane protein [Mariniflexile fucanivorans]
MKYSNYIKAIGLHVLIGIAIYALPFLSKVYFFGIVVYYTNQIFKTKPSIRAVKILMACAYVVGAEVFIRMTGGSFLYEASKYLVILFCLIGLFTVKKQSQPIAYIIYMLLLIPGIFVAAFNMSESTTLRTAIAFNLSGPICLGIVSVFCYKLKVSYNNIHKIFFTMALPLIATTTYLFLFNPSVRDTITGTGSNFEASGGFGPNQVATVLGLGMFVFSIRFFSQSPSKLYKVINVILFFLISYRAIITFSRGGVITALFMIAAFVFFYFKKVNVFHKLRISRMVVVFIGIGFSIWLYSSLQTGGFIDKRYANKDALGREKEDVTTGRGDLISFEFNEFLNNPLVGVGVGKIKELREQKEGVLAASHNEMSRIVSEHGLLGVIAFSILLFTPLMYRLENRSNLFFYSCYLFWLLTINHSSMRIAAPAFIYGLCLLTITYETNKTKSTKNKAISKHVEA